MTKDFQTKILPILLLIVKFSLISIFARSIGPTIVTLISLLFSSLICPFIFYYIIVFFNDGSFQYKKILFIFFIIFIFSLQPIFINIINPTISTIILLLNSCLACSLIFYYMSYYNYFKQYNESIKQNPTIIKKNFNYIFFNFSISLLFININIIILTHLT